jgi:hypothetical protein
LLHEQPGVLVPAVAVDEHDRVARVVRAEREVGDRPPTDLDELRLRFVRGFQCPGRDGRPRLLHGRVDLRVRHVHRRDDGEHRTDRQVRARLGDDPPDRSLDGRLQGAGDLVGLDVDDVVALGDRVALRHEPVDDLARLHRQAPLGHGHLLDPVIGHSPPPSSPHPRSSPRPG